MYLLVSKSGLDVTIQAQYLPLLKDIQTDMGLWLIFITHDFGIVAKMCDLVAVMYAGRIVESADVRELFNQPRHPYTQALVSAALPSHPDIHREEIILPGEVPSPLHVPAGCRFHPRCPQAMLVCTEIDPAPKVIASGHMVACHLY